MEYFNGMEWDTLMNIVSQIENTGYQFRIEGVWSLGSRKIKGHYIKIWNEKEDKVDEYYENISKREAVANGIIKFFENVCSIE